MRSHHLILALLLWSLLIPTATQAAHPNGETLYSNISSLALAPQGGQTLVALNQKLSNLNWNSPKVVPLTFQGNLRQIRTENGNAIYLIRSTRGELFLLALPLNSALLEKGAPSPYAGFTSMLSAKMTYHLETQPLSFQDVPYQAVRFTASPKLSTIDRVFRIAIVVVLFAVMLGMGMTLTPKDFSSVFKQPTGIFIGLICLFGIMPLIACAFGRLFGYAQAYPFIYVGMILITATPGGATSNLMTHLAKGDVALSISMTAIATVLSLVVTPALLLLYCANLPQVEMPVKMVMLPIFVLVLLPLVFGMLIKAKAENFSQKATPLFNIIGVIAVLICISGGIAGNPEMFKNSLEKFGITGFAVVTLLVISAMVMGGIVPRILKISTFQCRAISMEIGIRNAILGMTIALLIQDRVGDFNSYMFAVCGLFAIVMYIIGALAIFAQKLLLPLPEMTEPSHAHLSQKEGQPDPRSAAP